MGRAGWICVLLLGLSVVASCGKDADRGKTAGRGATEGRAGDALPSDSTAALYLPPVLADPALASVAVDSAGVALGDWDMAYPATDREGFWLVDFTWFYLEERPVKLYTFAELFELESAGAIDTSTVVSFAIYRMGTEAEDYADLLQRSKDLRPSHPPEALIRAVETFLEPGKP